MKVTICGGGNVAHALAAVLSVTDDVSVMTRKPDLWGRVLEYKKGGADYVRGRPLRMVSSSASALEDAALIIISVPRFAINEVLEKIGPRLHMGQVVAFIPAPAGLEDVSVELKRKYGVETIGFQRVPYIARISEYGHAVALSDDRAVHKTVMSGSLNEHFWDEFFTSRFGGTMEHLSSFFAFTFSNANALLHPARLMVLLNKTHYDRIPLFYEEWTDESSELYVKSDAEMLSVMRKYPEVEIGKDYESALDHYGVASIPELTSKIRSIPSFRGIQAPYKLFNGHYVPDLASRYFTEDAAYGTEKIQLLAKKVACNIPTIDMFVARIKDAMRCTKRT